MASGLFSFACVVLLSLNLVADGKRLNRPVTPFEQEPPPSQAAPDHEFTLPQQAADKPIFLQVDESIASSQEGSGSSVDAAGRPKELDGGQCAERIASKSFEVIERLRAYFSPPCNVESSMLGDEPPYELSEEGATAICTPRCFNNPALSTPLSGIQEIVDECGTDASFAMFESTYAMVHVMDVGRSTCTPTDADDIAGTGSPASPVEAPKRGKIAQMMLQIDFKNALATRGVPDCDNLKKVFSDFDLRRQGYLSVDDYNKVLYSLEEHEKQEGIELLESYFEEGQQTVACATILQKRLDVKAASTCFLGYVTNS